MTFTIDTYAVIGDPVAQSKSPLIHKLFAQQSTQILDYLKIHATMDTLAKTIDDFCDQGGKGLNITAPFKLAAMQLVDKLTDNAKQAGAINTIIINQNGSRLGENTDGIGLVRDITINHSYSFTNKHILLLGAGGAAKGILPHLLNQQPASLTIINRTLSKAEQLIATQQTQISLHAYDYSKLHDLAQTYDLILNATSASLHRQTLTLPKSIINTNTFCYDLSYAEKPTLFLQWCQQQGARYCIDGKGMLVEQAAESFYLWRGIRPDTQSIIKKL